MDEEIRKIEEEFGKAMIQNDAEIIGRLLADDWVIIDPDGALIDRARFLELIESEASTHQAMESSDMRIRIYANTATATALTTSAGRYMGHEFKTKERATDVFVKKHGQWKCVVSQLTRFVQK